MGIYIFVNNITVITKYIIRFTNYTIKIGISSHTNNNKDKISYLFLI